MAITVHKDLTVVAAREEGGRVVEVTTEAIIESDDAATDWAATDSSAVLGMLSKLTTESIAMDPGAVLNATSAPNMFLDGRSAEVLNGSQARIRAHYVYANLSMAAQEIVQTVAPQLSVTTRDTEPGGILAVTQVTHDGIKQQGEYTALMPEMVLEFDIIQSTPNPLVVVDRWLGKVNSDSWNGMAAGHLLVTSMPYRPVAVGLSGVGLPDKYIFTMVLTYRTVKWQPEVTWKDWTYGRAPVNLTGEGRKFVPHYKSRAFFVNSLDTPG